MKPKLTKSEQEHGSVAMGDGREATILREALNAIQSAQSTNHGCMATILANISKIAAAALSLPVQEPVAKRWLVEETLQGGSIRWKTYEHEHIARMAAAGDNKTLTALYAAPQPAHGTSATDPEPAVSLRGIETSIDTMREAARDLLVKQGWKPGSQLSGRSAVGLMAEFGMRVYRGEVECGYPDCGCCADAACVDAVKQHPDLGGTPPAPNAVTAGQSVEVERLRGLIRWAHDTLYEINLSNYDHDEVCKVSDASVEVILGLAVELGEKHGKPDEWWATRAALVTPTPKEESK